MPVHSLEKLCHERMRLLMTKQDGFQTLKSNGMAIDTRGTLENSRGKYQNSLRFPKAINDEVNHFINSERY